MADTNPILQTVALQVPTTVRSLVEALIFGAREPLSVRQIQAMYEDQGTLGAEPRKIDYEEITRIVEELNGEYTAAERPYRIVQIAGGYQFATMPAYAEWLGKLYKEQARRKLSQSSIETLAIIAYKQPITKPELESIRGVNCDYVIKTLLEKDLATIVGRASTVGRPLLYGTSKEFLKHFGLNDLNDLPRPREIQEILGDGQYETERRMLEAQQGMQEKKEEDFKSRLPHIPKRKPGLDDDVKILHKKQTREIKVRPTDDTEAAPPEEVKQEGQLELPTPVPQNQMPPVDEVSPTESLEVPIIENEGMPEVSGSDPEKSRESEVSVPPEQADYLSLTRPVELESEREVSEAPMAKLEEPTIQEETSEIVSVSENAVEDVSPEEILPAIPLETPATIVPPEEKLTEVTEPVSPPTIEEELVVEPPIVREEETAMIAPARTTEESVPSTVQSGEEDRIPQSVSLSILEHPEGPSHLEPGPSPELATGQQSTSQPKTRWKSWKEKIQGFIKRLFG